MHSFGAKQSISAVFIYIFILLAITIVIASGGNHSNNEENNKYKELNEWEPPKQFKEDYPYFLAGYDLERRPVWVVPFWKWDFHKVTEMDAATLKDFEKYKVQFLQRIENSPKFVPKDSENQDIVDTWALLINMDGFDLSQLSNSKALRLLIKMVSSLEITAHNLDYGFVINTNFVAERFIVSLKPFLGKVLDRLSILGTRKEKWYPELLKWIPKTTLPPSFGGFKNHSKIASFG